MTEYLIRYIELAAVHAPTYGLLLVLIFMTIESSFIPFPSEVVMIPAGFLAARGAMLTGDPLLDASLAIVAGTVGSLAGAFVNYGLAAGVGAPFLERYGRYFFLPPDKLRRAEELFRRYGPGATFVCRLLPAIRQLISIPAGLARMRMGSFAFWTGLGAGIWVIVLTFVGYRIGAHTTHLSYAELVHLGKDSLSQHSIWVVPTLLAGFAAYVWLSKLIMAPSGASSKASPAK